MADKNLTPNQKRCADCVCLLDGWKCDECFGQSIEDIDDCPEGITLEAVSASAEVKAKNYAKNAEKQQKTEKRPKTVKISDEKAEIFNFLLENLQENYENVEVLKPNKLICLIINGKTLKIDLIQGRNKD